MAAHRRYLRFSKVSYPDAATPRLEDLGVNLDILAPRHPDTFGKPSPGTDQEVGGDYKANVDPKGDIREVGLPSSSITMIQMELD